MKKGKTFETNSFVEDRQQFEIIKRTTRSDVEGVKLGNHEVRWNKKTGAALIEDMGLAREIFYTQGLGKA